MFGDYKGSVENGFSGANFWVVFAVYFPAVTGIMAGANMSGDLKDPRNSIPVGTLAAIALSYVLYVGLAILVAFLATPQELLENYNILIDKAFFAPVVLAGLLGATFSSALSSLVGAPRILQALGQNNILMYNEQLAKTDKKGEPKFAFYFTCVVVALSLLMRDLNAIAPLLTMFFLITYAMINVVVLVEQGLGQISFRPTLKVPFIIPLLGAIGCFFVMFIINSTVGLMSIGLVLAMYIYLTKRKNLDTQEGDTRSGMFNALAEWSAKVVNSLPEANERAWQPNLLVPAQNVNDVVRCYKTIYNLARPKGSVKMIGFSEYGEGKKMAKRLPELSSYFMEQEISANSAMIENVDYQTGVMTCMQGMKASFFSPNSLFLSLTDDGKNDKNTEILLRKAKEYGFGAYLYVPFKKVGLGLEKTLNLWIDIREVNRDIKFKVEDFNIALLTAYLLKRNWKAKLSIIVVIKDAKNLGGEKVSAKAYMKKLMTLTRMPKDTEIHYLGEDFESVIEDMPHADLNIFPLQNGKIDIAKIRRQSALFETSILYTLDSGVENAMA